MSNDRVNPEETGRKEKNKFESNENLNGSDFKLKGNNKYED